MWITKDQGINAKGQALLRWLNPCSHCNRRHRLQRRPRQGRPSSPLIEGDRASNYVFSCLSQGKIEGLLHAGVWRRLNPMWEIWRGILDIREFPDGSRNFPSTYSGPVLVCPTNGLDLHHKYCYGNSKVWLLKSGHQIPSGFCLASSWTMHLLVLCALFS